MKNKDKKEGSDRLNELRPLADALTPVVEDLPDPRFAKTVMLMRLGLSRKDAGVLAGYAKSYANSGLSNTLKSSKKCRDLVEKFAQRSRADYPVLAQLLLGDIAKIKAQRIRKLADNPEKELNVVDFRMMRDIEKISGVLEDTPLIMPVVNVVAVQEHLRAIDERIRKQPQNESKKTIDIKAEQLEGEK